MWSWHLIGQEKGDFSFLWVLRYVDYVQKSVGDERVDWVTSTVGFIKIATIWISLHYVGNQFQLSITLDTGSGI